MWGVLFSLFVIDHVIREYSRENILKDLSEKYLKMVKNKISKSKSGKTSIEIETPDVYFCDTLITHNESRYMYIMTFIRINQHFVKYQINSDYHCRVITWEILESSKYTEKYWYWEFICLL